MRLSARGLQLLSAVIALATTASGVVGGAGSRSTIFAILMNYTAMLYGVYMAVAVEALERAPRLPDALEMVLDGVLAFALFLAGVIVATWDVYKNCEEINIYGSVYGVGETLKCGNLATGIVFSFVGMLAFIVTLALTLWAKKVRGMEVVVVESEQQTAFVTTATPSAALSPIGVQATAPHAKV
ncbi:hypothetical protein PINS_up000927 [Pythium insidiosum]|nr:hypothetical protein PINS_up000927 [Pythium insidiosum]